MMVPSGFFGALCATLYQERERLKVRTLDTFVCSLKVLLSLKGSTMVLNCEATKFNTEVEGRARRMVRSQRRVDEKPGANENHVCGKTDRRNRDQCHLCEVSGSSSVLSDEHGRSHERGTFAFGFQFEVRLAGILREFRVVREGSFKF